MTLILQTFLASLVSIVFENVIFAHAFGTSTLIELSKKHWNILSFSGFITEFAVLSGVISYAFEGLMLSNDVSARFLPGVYILSLGAVYVFTLIAIWSISKDAFKKLKKYVHLSAFNCTVLSVLFNNTLMGGSLIERIIYAVEIGIGFAFSAYIILINYDKLSSDEVPSTFAGFPIYVLYIGVISMIIYAVSN